METIQIQTGDDSDAAAVADFMQDQREGQIQHTIEGSRLLKAASGGRWQTDFWIARRGSQIVGVMPVAVQRIKMLGGSVLRSPGGPIGADGPGGEVVATLLDALIEEGRRRKRWQVECWLPLIERSGGEVTKSGAAYLEALAARKLQRQEPPYFGTYLTQLADDETMLKSFTSKCRRDIRKGLREGVTVEACFDRDSLDEFANHYESMKSRKSIAGVTREFLTDAVWPCIESGLASIFISRHNDQSCNYALVSLVGRPRYWLGATSEYAVQKGVPPSGQVLHFGVMQYLREHGWSQYDLGGSPAEVPEKGHPNYGVWRFKFEFQGLWAEYLDNFQLSLFGPGTALLKWRRRLAERMAR